MLICRKRNVSDVKHRVFVEMSANSVVTYRENRERGREKAWEEDREKREETENERETRENMQGRARRGGGEGEERDETDHVGGGSAQRLRKTHKQAYYNNGRACCTNTISAWGVRRTGTWPSQRARSITNTPDGEGLPPVGDARVPRPVSGVNLQPRG